MQKFWKVDSILHIVQKGKEKEGNLSAESSTFLLASTEKYA